MSYNGSGTFNLYTPGNPVVTSTTISSTWANNTLSDIATGLSNAITKDGQTTVTANLPMGGFKHTGVAVASNTTDYARADQSQNSSLQWLTSVSGTDTITASAPIAPAAYASGQTFRFVSAGANTGAVTLNVSSLGAKSVTKRGTTALVAGDIPSNAVVVVTYDGTRFQLINVITSDVLFPGVKQGLTLSNNGSDATNDLDIAAGKAVDTTGAVVMSLASTMVKQLDVNWAAGTNQGGRYSGASIANTTYHVWLVSKAAGADVDVYMDPSADASTVLTHLQAETGGADYLYLWRIGSILRESAAIVPFAQTMAEFLRKTAILELSITNSTTSAVTTTLSVPVGVSVVALMNVAANGDGAGNVGAVYLSSLDVTDQAASGTVAPLVTVGAQQTSAGGATAQAQVRTNTSAQIRRRTQAASGATTYIATLGWIDSAIYGA